MRGLSLFRRHHLLKQSLAEEDARVAQQAADALHAAMNAEAVEIPARPLPAVQRAAFGSPVNTPVSSFHRHKLND